MSATLPQLGKETVITALGKTWTVGRWTTRVWEDLIVWLKPQLPDPYAHLERLIDKMAPEVANEALRRAEERANEYLSIGSPKIMALLKFPEPSLYVLWLLLREKHPNITRDEALMISEELSPEKKDELFSDAAGTPPPSGNP